jgi:hypothetical protein
MPGFCRPTRDSNACYELLDADPTGSIIGSYDGVPIAEEVMDECCRRFGYVGAAPRRTDGSYDLASLRLGEFVIGPGLLYRLKGMKGGSPKERGVRFPARMRRLRKEGHRVAAEMAHWLFG